VASYKRTPILRLEERIQVIEACRYVDEVIPAPPLRTTKQWLEKHQIDLVIHGDDFQGNMISDHYEIPLKMGIFKTVPYTQGISTTNIIQRIKARVQKEATSD